MSVLVKMPHMEIEIRGENYLPVVNVLKSAFDNVTVEKENPVNIEETDWFQEISESWSPSTELRANRLKNQLSQTDLGKKIGKSRQYVSDLEKDRRNITKPLAKKLGAIFKCDYRRFL